MMNISKFKISNYQISSWSKQFLLKILGCFCFSIFFCLIINGQTQKYEVTVAKEAIQKINRLSFSADGRFMLTHEKGNKSIIKIWDKQFKLIKAIPLSGRTAKEVAIGPKGRFVAYVVGKSDIEIWDAKYDAVTFGFKSGLYVNELKFNPNGKMLVASGEQIPSYRQQNYQNSGFGNTKKPYRANVEVFDFSKIDTKNEVTPSKLYYDGTQCSVLDFSSDGKYLLGAQYRSGWPNLIVWETATSKRVVMKELAIGKSFMQASFIPDAEQLVYNSESSYHVVDAKTGREIRKLPRRAYESTEFLLNDKKQIIYPSYDGFEQADITTGKVIWRKRKSEKAWLMEIHPTEPIMCQIMNDGTVEIWNYESKELMFILHSTDSAEGYVLIGKDGYYFGSKEGVKDLEVKQGNKTFAFEQFDLMLNRPDKIYATLPNIDANQLAAYKTLVAKRTKWNGGAVPSDLLSASLPVLSFLSTKNEFSKELVQQQNGKIDLEISMGDSLKGLSQLDVWVNSVPLFGRAGKKLNLQKLITKKIPIQLSHGKNEISAKVKNQDGTASLIKKMTIEYTKPNFKEQLHFIGIGVSTYEQANKIEGLNNLEFAHKDIEDMANFLEQNATGKKTVKSTLLLNEQATQANILSLKEQLSTFGLFRWTR